MIEISVNELNKQLQTLNMYLQGVSLVPKENGSETEYGFRIKDTTIELTPVIAHNAQYYYVILCIFKKGDNSIYEQYTFTVNPKDVTTIGDKSVLRIQDPSVKFTEDRDQSTNYQLFNNNVGYDCMTCATRVQLISNK